MSYKPIGGVKRATLHSADTVGLQSDGLYVELVDDRSSYTQKLSVENGVAVVVHTLTLVALCTDAAPWLSDQFIESASREGLIAKVELNDSQHLVVGLSERLLFEQPLRLQSIVVDSALSAAQTPTVTLTLQSQSDTLAGSIN